MQKRAQYPDGSENEERTCVLAVLTKALSPLGPWLSSSPRTWPPQGKSFSGWAQGQALQIVHHLPSYGLILVFTDASEQGPFRSSFGGPSRAEMWTSSTGSHLSSGITWTSECMPGVGLCFQRASDKLSYWASVSLNAQRGDRIRIVKLLLSSDIL